MLIYIVTFFSIDKRYKNQQELLHRRQVMFGNGTELTALRAVSDTMMTEFNPNYEFAGNLYSFKDLPQIPRDNITLVKLVQIYFNLPRLIDIHQKCINFNHFKNYNFNYFTIKFGSHNVCSQNCFRNFSYLNLNMK